MFKIYEVWKGSIKHIHGVVWPIYSNRIKIKREYKSLVEAYADAKKLSGSFVICDMGTGNIAAVISPDLVYSSKPQRSQQTATSSTND